VSSTMAPTTTSWKLCTNMVCSLHPTVRRRILAQSLVAKAYAQHYATMIANIAHQNMSGAGATCMVWESTLQTWHQNLTDMCLSLRWFEAAGGAV